MCLRNKVSIQGFNGIVKGFDYRLNSMWRNEINSALTQLGFKIYREESLYTFHSWDCVEDDIITIDMDIFENVVAIRHLESFCD